MSKHLDDQIRLALSSGEFQHAHLLWQDYARQIEDEIRRGVCPESRIREAGELVEWARRVALCANTMAMRRLNSHMRESRAAEAYRRIALDSGAATAN